MAGVVLTTSVVTGPTTLTISPTSTLFVAGVTERGPEGEAFLCQSLSDYQDIFGGYVSTGYVHQTVQTFFEEGGSRVYVSRVIDQSAAVAASATITAATSGTALTIVAGGEGTWANTMLDAQVATTAGGFRIRILLDDEVVYSTPVVTTTAEAIEELTSSDLARAYVYDAVVGAGSGLPAAGTYAFSGGTNGSTLIDADYTAASAPSSRLSVPVPCAFRARPETPSGRPSWVTQRRTTESPFSVSIRKTRSRERFRTPRRLPPAMEPSSPLGTTRG